MARKINALGDRTIVALKNGFQIACEIRFINAGKGWLFPIVDDPSDPTTGRHVAIAKIDEKGKVTLL
jgi:hypothetical protein